MTFSALRSGALALLALCAAGRAFGVEPVMLRLERQLSESAAKVTEDRPLFGQSDQVSARARREITMRDGAELRRAGTTIRADRITYYPQDDEVVAVGAVRVFRDNAVFSGPQLRLKLDANEGTVSGARFELPVYGGTGTASSVEFQGPDRTTLLDALYTTCDPRNPDWYLQAESLTLDERKQQAEGRWGSLVFMDRKILTGPSFGFPLSNERRSGFLAPSYAVNSRTGLELTAPYYVNIAPNRDLTLMPRLMARSGLQLGGDLRFMEPHTLGQFKFEVTPNDALTGTTRYLAGLQQTFVNVGGWNGIINMKGVSDDKYFVDYSRTILGSSERSLPRSIVASRGYGDWTLTVNTTSYQNILEARNAPPYERLPQVTALWSRLDERGFDLESTFDAALFRRPLPGAVEGARFVANPRISYPIVRPGWFVVPKLGLHLTSYQLDTNPGFDTNLTRSVPTFSLDSGLIFERYTDLFGKQTRQTLEPRMFYVRSAYRDQTGLPVFDSGVADFNFAQLFSENPFIGHDRISDSNQLTSALVSRVIDPGTGVQTLRLAFGQRQYFADQQVSIPGRSLRTDRRSDLLFAAGAQITRSASVDAGVQYSLGEGRLPRMNLQARYLPPDGRILNVAVRHVSDQIGQIDTSWRWPVMRNVRMIGRINYSWLRQSTGILTEPGIIEGLLGMEYGADCWIGRFLVHQFVTAQGQTTSAVFLQIELSGLGRLGSDPFDILRRSIPGYQLPADNPQAPSRFFGYE